MEILPSITTIFDWRGKVKEVQELGLKEVSFFLTCLNPKERQEFYLLLKNSKIERIPFVHIKSDVSKDELDYLIKNYQTEAFNTHTKREYPYHPNYKEYSKMTYIENTYEPFDEKELKEFAGICLDLSHLENSRLFRPSLYKHNVKVVEKYGCGCNHIGPTKNFSIFDKTGTVKYPREKHPHTLEKLSELDYLKQYPARYFGKFIALEMENSIKEQLRAIDYIVNML